MGFSIESMLKLEQRFDPKWFIPKDTFLSKFLQKKADYYPSMGFEAGVYFGSLDYAQEINNIDYIVNNLSANGDMIKDVQSWVAPFQEYVKKNFKKGKIMTKIYT